MEKIKGFNRRNVGYGLGFLWKASGDIEKRQRMANGPANEVRHSMFAAPFSIRCAVSYLFFFIFAIFQVRYSMFAAPFAIRRAIDRTFFLFISPNFRYSRLAIQCFAAPLAIRQSPEPFAAPFAVRRFSMSPNAFHRFQMLQQFLRIVINCLVASLLSDFES